MKNYKQLLAGALAAVMVLGSSVVAMADEGSTTGQGSLDIVKESDVFNVVLPVVADEGSVFDYILDPTGVINATNAEKYAGAKFEEGETLFFAVSGGDNDYAHKSDTLTATNKSTMDVEISVKASVAEVAGVTMAEDTNFVSGGDAQLYLGLFDDVDNTTGVAITVEGVEATATIAGADDQYQIKYVSDGDYYTKELADDASGFDAYNFYLEGACSVDGWDGLEENPPAVEVVWSVENPVVTGPKVTLTTDGLITMSGLTANVNYAHSAFLNYKGVKNQLDSDPNLKWGTDDWSEEKGGTLTFQLNAAWLKALQGCEVTITVELTDGSSITSDVVQF